MSAVLCPAYSGTATLPSPFIGEYAVLPFASAAYEVLGEEGLPTVAVFGGISATRHLAAHDGDPRAGWWDTQVGPGRAIDTARFRVIGVDYLGADLVRGDGIPPVDSRDQARALAAVLDALGIERLHALVGSSYGGMVALAFASLFPERVERIVVIGAAHEPHPMATAVRSVQRRIVALGLASGRAGEGLALARALAMTTYRTPEEFAERFAAAPASVAGGVRFPVEEYLDHCGRRYVETCSPERFLCLSQSIDLHRIDPRSVRVPATLVAVEGDGIAPPWQVRELAARLGGAVTLREIESRYGHDAFLKEADTVSSILVHALQLENHA